MKKNTKVTFSGPFGAYSRAKDVETIECWLRALICGVNDCLVSMWRVICLYSLFKDASCIVCLEKCVAFVCVLVKNV